MCQRSWLELRGYLIAWVKVIAYHPTTSPFSLVFSLLVVCIHVHLFWLHRLPRSKQRLQRRDSVEMARVVATFQLRELAPLRRAFAFKEASRLSRDGLEDCHRGCYSVDVVRSVLSLFGERWREKASRLYSQGEVEGGKKKNKMSEGCERGT